MSNIFSFEERIRNRKFNEQVIDEISKLNSYYDFSIDGDSGIAYLHHNVFICIFFKFIPRSETTTLPSVIDSLNGLTKTEEIYSTGEWFVESLYRLEKGDYYKLLPFVYKKDKEKGWIENVKDIAYHCSIRNEK